jgi:MtrB/PioB family decaheme-associated outer membrane protein
MNVKNKLLLTTTVLMIAVPASFAAAQEQQQQEGLNTWGEIEAGWRSYIKRPPQAPAGWGNADTSVGELADRNNIAKFWEYGSVKPGLFLETFNIGAETKDRKYFGELRASNVGSDYQKYVVDLQKTGEHYFTFTYDQIPHLYSTSAQSIWCGTTALVPCSLPNQAANIAALNNAAVSADITANLHTTTLGIQRKSGEVNYRWTPDPNWDVKLDYFQEKREGTQLAGFSTADVGGTTLQVPRPISDTTQNIDANGEYNGIMPWGGKFNIGLGYSTSQYRNDFKSYTVQNPFADGTLNPPGGAAINQFSLMPSNQMHGVTVQGGVDLPKNSRYNGTLSYSMMRQNDDFLPYSSEPAALALLANPVLPAGSLNGQINTFLSNNVLNIPITKDLKSTTSYRYYDFDNRTPEITFPDYVVTDNVAAGAPRRSLTMSYTKQNASEELAWRATKWANLGISAEWEHYDRTRRAANVTNEWTGKAFADLKLLANVLLLRSSVQYSERRFDNYDWTSYVLTPALAGANSTGLRTFDLANRNRTKANVSLDFTPPFLRGLTITPTVGLRSDSYGLNPSTEFGLNKDRALSAGIEAAYVIKPGATVTLAYMREKLDREIWSADTAMDPLSRFNFKIKETVDTYMAAVNFELIPDRLEWKISYTYMHDSEKTSDALQFDPAAWVGSESWLGGFPDVKTDFQRLESTWKYKFDPDLVAKMGLKGQAYAKLRYAWQANRVTNWQQDNVAPYMFGIDPAFGGQTILMGATNPNYNVQLITASLGVKW